MVDTVKYILVLHIPDIRGLLEIVFPSLYHALENNFRNLSTSAGSISSEFCDTYQVTEHTPTVHPASSGILLFTPSTLTGAFLFLVRLHFRNFHWIQFAWVLWHVSGDRTHPYGTLCSAHIMSKRHPNFTFCAVCTEIRWNVWLTWCVTCFHRAHGQVDFTPSLAVCSYGCFSWTLHSLMVFNM